MNLKLDENLPRRAAVFLSEHGHDVSTVLEEELAGAKDAVVAGAAAREGRFLVTLDRGMGDLRAHPPGTHPGVAVLRLHNQDAASVMDALERFVTQFDISTLEGCIIIVEDDRVRIRRRAGPSVP